MARFVVLMDWTEQGIKTAKDSPQRARQAREAFRAKGVEIEHIWWTLGSHDLVAVASAPDGLDLAAVLLALGGAGNLRTTTLRAFDEAEFGEVLSRLG